MAGLHKDIGFLKKCRKYNLTPISHRIKVKSVIPMNVVKRMESEHIKETIKRLYSKLNLKTLECYALHLKLAKQYSECFQVFLTKVKVAEKCEAERKRKLLAKKFKVLSSQKVINKKPRPTVQALENFVVNRSSQIFTDKQTSLLNQGLNYAIASRPNLEQVIIDVETGINKNNLPSQHANEARSLTAGIIKQSFLNNKKEKRETEIVKELREKPVFYIKADKGNKIVIMDKDDYDELMMQKIINGPYRQLRVNPLPDMVKRFDKTVKECKDILEANMGHLKSSNPTLSRIKGLPKIHKPGNEMREIISAEGSPTQKLAKWLVKEFQAMPKKFFSRSVKSTQEFANLLQNSGHITEDEIMVSFDVTARAYQLRKP